MLAETPSALRIVVADGGFAEVTADLITFDSGAAWFWAEGAAVACHLLRDIERVELVPPMTAAERHTSAVSSLALVVEEVRREHPQAYRRWSAHEDALLLDGRRTGATLTELAERHGRQPSAIQSRLAKLTAPRPEAPAAPT
ncbi:hypothetical protein [Subtercola lobariae]|uniref:Uncharacterized protein n=1 Tax=Subtercola lobariae TaxID=1588641 RepID=A0A917BB34_9MICO|nr:hypothetical protein [Subtercola lobariae]GGF34852.1 hypothetical protein GCM10011399_29920 [Subtercola lobariae]